MDLAICYIYASVGSHAVSSGVRLFQDGSHPRDFICDYKIATTKAKRTTFKLYDIVYGDPCDLFEKRASANGSIMHNHVARRKV